MRSRILFVGISLFVLLLGAACQPAGTGTLPSGLTPTAMSTVAAESTMEPASTAAPAEETDTPEPEMTATLESTTTPEVSATMTATLSSEAMLMQGEEVYADTCSACHGENGEGTGDFPALAANPNATDADSLSIINLVVHGQNGQHDFGSELSDMEIAAVLSFIRNSWGNEAEPVTAEEVESVRSTPLPSPTP
jgi:mono/diheme cytochrome c family protein